MKKDYTKVGLDELNTQYYDSIYDILEKWQTEMKKWLIANELNHEVRCIETGEIGELHIYYENDTYVLYFYPNTKRGYIGSTRRLVNMSTVSERFTKA